MGVINFNMKNVQFGGDSSFIRELNNGEGMQSASMMDELREISKKLEHTEPIIANAAQSLADAAAKNDQTGIKKWARMLATGTAQSIIGSMASTALMDFISGH
mgnify:CR=1 FL=1